MKPSGNAASSAFASGSGCVPAAATFQSSADHPVTGGFSERLDERNARHFGIIFRLAVGPFRGGTHRGAAVIERADHRDRRGVGASVMANLIEVDGAENFLRAVSHVRGGTANAFAIQPISPSCPIGRRRRRAVFFLLHVKRTTRLWLFSVPSSLFRRRRPARSAAHTHPGCFVTLQHHRASLYAGDQGKPGVEFVKGPRGIVRWRTQATFSYQRAGFLWRRAHRCLRARQGTARSCCRWPRIGHPNPFGEGSRESRQ